MKFGRAQENNIKIEAADNLDTIEKAVKEFDAVFSPPISDDILDFKVYSKKLYEKGIVLLAKEKDENIGLAIFYANDFDSRVSYLTQIAVKQTVQQNGIGSLLLKQCLDRATSLKMDTMKLEVISTNESAINFYKKHGFQYLGKASQDSLYMGKEL